MKKLAIVLAGMVSLSAHSEYVSGNDLLERLNGESFFTKGFAMGYILGAADAGYRTWHCTPLTVQAGQAQDIVKLYLVNNPTVRPVSADSIVNIALGIAYPCKKGGA